MPEPQHIERKELIRNISGKCTELTYLTTEKITQWGITWGKVFEPIDRRQLNEIFEKNQPDHFYSTSEDPTLIWMTVIAAEGSFLKSENRCFSISKNDFVTFKNNLESISDNMIWKKIGF